MIKTMTGIMGAWLISLNCMAGPTINVGMVYDYLDGDKSTYLKRVFNGGDSTAFVRVSIKEILYKADGSSEEVEVKTQTDKRVRDGLMSSPARLIVPPNGTQGARLLFMGDREQERYFRVRFIPVVPEKEDEFALSSEQARDYKKTLSAGVNVLAGYGTVFFVRPKETRFDTQIENTPNHYQLRNQGNSVVVVDEFKDCASSDRLHCKPTTKTHVLPGRTLRFDKQPGRHYRFTLVEGRAQKVIEVKA